MIFGKGTRNLGYIGHQSLLERYRKDTWKMLIKRWTIHFASTRKKNNWITRKIWPKTHSVIELTHLASEGHHYRERGTFKILGRYSINAIPCSASHSISRTRNSKKKGKERWKDTEKILGHRLDVRGSRRTSLSGGRYWKDTEKILERGRVVVGGRKIGQFQKKILASTKKKILSFRRMKRVEGRGRGNGEGRCHDDAASFFFCRFLFLSLSLRASCSCTWTTSVEGERKNRRIVNGQRTKRRPMNGAETRSRWRRQSWPTRPRWTTSPRGQ